MPNKVMMFIILFVALALIGISTITMISEIDVPNQTDTPELYEDYVEQQEVVQPFFLGMNAVTIFILICVIFAGVSLLIVSLRKFGRV